MNANSLTNIAKIYFLNGELEFEDTMHESFQEFFEDEGHHYDNGKVVCEKSGIPYILEQKEDGRVIGIQCTWEDCKKYGITY